MRVWLLSSVFRSSAGSWLFTALVNADLLAEPLAAGAAGFSAAGFAAGAAAAGAAAGAAGAAAAAVLAAGASARAAAENRLAASSVMRVLLIFCMRVSLGKMD